MSDQKLRFKKHIRDEQDKILNEIVIIFSKKLTEKEFLTVKRIAHSVIEGSINLNDTKYLKKFSRRSQQK